MPLSRIGIAWQSDDLTPSGQIGLNLALSLIKAGKTSPLLYDIPKFITPPAGALELLRPFVKETELLRGELKATEKAAVLKDILALHDLHHDLVWREVSARITGAKNVGFAYIHHLPLTQTALQRATHLDRIMVFGTWQEQAMKDFGFENVVHWRPGYDDWLFYPRDAAEKPDDLFVIYSAATMHLANGQDLALEAFKRFRESHPDSVLVTSWHTPYVDQLQTLANNRFGFHIPDMNEDHSLKITEWAARCGLPENAVIDTGVIGAQNRPTHVATANIALFPNRCSTGAESGALETMAMGIPCILSKNTAHLDMIADGNCLVLEDQTPVHSDHVDMSGWGESSIDEIVAHLEWAYDHRDEAKAIGAKGRESVQPYTWTNQTQDLLDKLSDLLEG